MGKRKGLIQSRSQNNLSRSQNNSPWKVNNLTTDIFRLSLDINRDEKNKWSSNSNEPINLLKRLLWPLDSNARFYVTQFYVDHI